MRGRFRAAIAGSVLAACALGVLCLTPLASAQARRHHPAPHAGRIGARRLLVRGPLHRIAARRVSHRHRHRASIAQRQAVIGGLVPVTVQPPGWIVFPSPNVAVGVPTGPAKTASPRALKPPPEPEVPLAAPEAPPISVPLAAPEEEIPPVSAPEEAPTPPEPPAEEIPTPPVPPAEEIPSPPVPPAEEQPAPSAPEEEPAPNPPESATPSIYWGASISDQPSGEQAPWDMSLVTKFEETAGKQLSLVNFFSPFANCASSPCSFYEFPSGPMESIRRHGAIPVFSWSSQSIPTSLSETNFELADVINGTYDNYIREFAEAAREWGHPFFLRFDWEMNGNWFPWAEGVNGNQSGEFVAAWRHVHDIFTSVGATNATWVWCPNVDPENDLQNLSSLYPGDEYVDWTGLDGYNWGTNPAKPDRWRSFDELYASTYQQIVNTIAPSKPLLISEIGSTEYGGSKAEWISEALAQIPTAYPQIHGLIWFDTYDDGMDWPIESSTSASSAFAAGISGPEYATSNYANLSTDPIQPPG